MPQRLLCRARAAGMILALGLAVAGCASTGDVANPVVRKATWYSFLNGDDLRPACVAGSPDRMRLVLNGRYDDQIRIYELSPSGDMDIRVVEPGDLTRLRLSQPTAPWSGVTATTALDGDNLIRLWDALERSDALRPAPDGLTLLSDRLYWVAVGCRQGQVFFHAWQHPSSAWDRLRFPPVLHGLDGTGIAFPPEEEPALTTLRSPRERDLGSFRLEVGPEGFKYLDGPFR